MSAKSIKLLDPILSIIADRQPFRWTGYISADFHTLVIIINYCIHVFTIMLV